MRAMGEGWSRRLLTTAREPGRDPAPGADDDFEALAYAETRHRRPAAPAWAEPPRQLRLERDAEQLTLWEEPPAPPQPKPRPPASPPDFEQLELDFDAPPQTAADADPALEEALYLLAEYDEARPSSRKGDYPEPDWLALAPAAPEAEERPLHPDLARVAVQVRLDDQQRAEILAAEWVERSGWPAREVARLARLLEAMQHGQTRTALWKAIQAGYDCDALEAACTLRAMWLEHPHFSVLPGSAPKGYHPSETLGWKLALRLATSALGPPERIEVFLEDLHDEWRDDVRLQRRWKVFEYYVHSELVANGEALPFRWARVPGLRRPGSLRVKKTVRGTHAAHVSTRSGGGARTPVYEQAS